MVEQKSVNGISFISLDEYANLNPDKVFYLHTSEKQLYYSYVPEDIKEKAVLHEGDVKQEFVVRIKNASCFAESDVILLDKTHAYCEFKDIERLENVADCADCKILIRDTPEEYEIRTPKKKKKIHAGIFLSGLFSVNYYHFTYAIIAKTELLDIIPDEIPLIMDNNVKKFDSYKSLIDICNKKKREIIYIDENVRYDVEDLYLISLPSFLAPNVYSGVVDQPVYTQYDIEVLRKFRQTVLEKKDTSISYPKRILLSRKNASSRRPFNEFECLQILKEYGFEAVYPEEMSFEQQVALFNNAEVIAGGSGAAFTNLLYCSEGCKIIMFIGYQISFSFWQPLISITDSRIFRLHDKDKGELTVDNHPYDIHAPFYIDPDELRGLLSHLGLEKQATACTQQEDKPAVTVSVLTYNSTATVLETLESIKRQTYPNIILQICDDHSIDKTLKICNEWIAENRERFVDVKIATSCMNYGVAYNSNRSIDLCETTWMKEIASDDILEDNCIETFMVNVDKFPEVAVVFSKVSFFGINQKKVKDFAKFPIYDFFTWTPEKQLNFLVLNRNCIPAASAFYNVSLLRKMKIRNDERIPSLEDWPKWINYLRKGGKFGFVDEALVRYRVGGGASTAPSLRYKYLFSQIKFDLLYRVPSYIQGGALDNYVAKMLSYQGGNNESDYERLLRKKVKHLKTIRWLAWLSSMLALALLAALLLLG